MSQFWPPPPPERYVIPLTIGVGGATGIAVPTLARVGPLLMFSGRVTNGNGLTLSSSDQTVATLPARFRPSQAIMWPGIWAAGVYARCVLNPAGELRVASSSTGIDIGGGGVLV